MGKFKSSMPNSSRVIDVFLKLFNELQGADTQQKILVAKCEEHRLAVRRGIVLLIFHTKVSS